MICRVCGSTMESVVTVLPFKASETTIVIVKGVPVFQCGHCREYELDDLVVERVEELLERADPAVELEVITYAA